MRPVQTWIGVTMTHKMNCDKCTVNCAARRAPPCGRRIRYLLNAMTLKRRRDLELRQLIRWASGREWQFARGHPRFRQQLRVPSHLEGDPDRANWPKILEIPFWTDFWGGRYRPTSGEALPALSGCASRRDTHPTEMLSKRTSGPCHSSKAPQGWRWRRSRAQTCCRNLPFVAFQYLAKKFESLACDVQHAEVQRPPAWSVALVFC